MRIHDLPDLLKGERQQPILAASIRDYKEFKQFDFGNIGSLSREENICFHKYQIELLQNDVFVTPFKTFSFSYSVKNPTNDIDCILICETKDDYFHFIWLARNKNEKGFYNNLTGFMSAISLKAALTCEGNDLEFIQPIIVVGDNCGEPVSEYWPVEKILSQALNNLFSMLSILDAENVERVVVKTTERINKKRINRGQCAILDCETIYLRVGGERYLPSGESTKGSHASPRCHWRRGHLRRLSNGQITKVRPCLVGKVGNENPLKKNYVVKRAG